MYYHINKKAYIDPIRYRENVMTTLSTYDISAAMLRITLGTLMVAHGLMKVIIFTVPGTVGFFESMGLPSAAAYLTIFAELVGGSALIAGLLTRVVALLSLPLMLGTIWAHSGNGWVFSNPNGGWEFPAFLTMATLIVAIQGGGRFALNRLPIISTFLPRTVTA